jgi:hypothetical protein
VWGALNSSAKCRQYNALVHRQRYTCSSYSLLDPLGGLERGGRRCERCSLLGAGGGCCCREKRVAGDVRNRTHELGSYTWSPHMCRRALPNGCTGMGERGAMSVGEPASSAEQQRWLMPS